MIISSFLFQKVVFSVLSWLLTKFFAFFLIILVIIFQPEFREGLARLGKRHFFYIGPKREEIENTIKEIVSAVAVMSQKKQGALIAIKRDIGLKNYIESGVVVNADVTSELITTIFSPLTILHDGGMIIEGTRIIAAGCLFPNSSNPNMERALGMRHRAAVGLSENSDALVMAVSEENGSVSLAINSQLTQHLTPSDLFTILKGQLSKIH